MNVDLFLKDFQPTNRCTHISQCTPFSWWC